MTKHADCAAYGQHFDAKLSGHSLLDCPTYGVERTPGLAGTDTAERITLEGGDGTPPPSPVTLAYLKVWGLVMS